MYCTHNSYLLYGTVLSIKLTVKDKCLNDKNKNNVKFHVDKISIGQMVCIYIDNKQTEN